MSIREAVDRKATQDLEVREANKPLSRAQEIEKQLDLQESQFKLLLPGNYDSKKFKRQTLSAIKASPDLMECFATAQGRTSLFLAAMNAASLGLEPNTPKQECWLLPRRIKGVMECQFSIGYRGYVKLIWGSGGVETIFFDVVRQGDIDTDNYEFNRTLKADIFRHNPTGVGDLVEAYAGVRYLDGAYSFIRLTKEQVYERRSKSDGWNNPKARPYSPWTTSEEAMWKKSALRALVPSLRLSEEAATELSTDESSFKPSEDGQTIIDIPEWQTTVQEEEFSRETSELPSTADVQATVLDVEDSPSSEGESSNRREVMRVALEGYGFETPEAQLAKINQITGKDYGSLGRVTYPDADAVTEALDAEADAKDAEM